MGLRDASASKTRKLKKSGQPFIVNLTAAEDCFQLVPKYELKVKLQKDITSKYLHLK